MHSVSHSRERDRHVSGPDYPEAERFVVGHVFGGFDAVPRLSRIEGKITWP